MSSYIEISSDDLNATNQPLSFSPKGSNFNLNLNESSELDFPSFAEYGITNPAILFTNKKTGIRPDTEIVDLISPSKPLSPLDSSSSILPSTQRDCVFLEISSSPPLGQDDNEEFENHSFANWDDMISEIPSINDLSPRSTNLDNIFNETHNLDTLCSHATNCDKTIKNIDSINDISQQVIIWDGINNEIPSLSDLSFRAANYNDNNNDISSLQELSPQSIRWDDVLNENSYSKDPFPQDNNLNDLTSEHSFLNDLLPQTISKTKMFNHISNLSSTSSKVLQSKETIAKLNKARPATEDACKQLFIKHSKDWIEENNDLGLSILNSIKSLDIDLIPCNETKISWCLEYFMVQNFKINKNDGLFYPVSEDRYKITPMNKILLKWNAKEIIEDLENFSWSPSKMGMSAGYSCNHEKSVYMLYPKSVTAFITNYSEIISTLQKNSKKTFEQQMAAFSQIPNNDPNSVHADEHEHVSKNCNPEKIQHLDQFLNYAQIKYSMNLVYMDDPDDIANYTKLFSSTVAEIPFRTETNQQGQKLNLEQLQSKKVPPMSDLSSSQNYFYKQLQQIPGVAPLTARAIVTSYPSPKHLIKAYQSTSTDVEKLSLISNLSISGDSLSQNSRTRNVGNSVAQKLLKIFYCSNGSETIL